MKFKEFVKTFVDRTKYYIGMYSDYKNLTGEEKKARLDEKMTDLVKSLLDELAVPFWAKWAIKKLIIENIPVITQAIYDLIKAKVKGVTE